MAGGIRYIVVRLDEDKTPGILGDVRRSIHSTIESRAAQDAADIVLDVKPTYLSGSLTEEDYVVVHNIFNRALEFARDQVRKRRADRG